MNVNEGLWAAKLPNGEVRSGTLEQLDEAFRAGHLGENTLVCASRSDRWIKLADVLRDGAAGAASTAVAVPRTSVPAPSASAQRPEAGAAHGGSEPGQVRHAQVRHATGERASGPPPLPALPQGSDELWQARLADGQVRSGTREQLEEAFHAGYLPEGTMVLAAGSLEWEALAAVAARRLSRPAPPPIVAPDLATVEAQPAGPDAVLKETPAATPEQAPAAERAQDEQPNLPPAWDEDETWQVHLTSQQLKQAFHAGLLDDDALVRAAGTEEWTRLGALRRPRSVPAGISLEPSGHDAVTTNGVHAEVDAPGASLEEPVSRTEPASGTVAASDRSAVDSSGDASAGDPVSDGRSGSAV